MVLVQKTIKKIYLWAKGGWPYEVNSNTMVYMPLTSESQLTDYWNLWRTYTSTWWIFIDDYYQTASTSEKINSAASYSSYSAYTITFWVNYFSWSSWYVWLWNARSWDSGNVQIRVDEVCWYNGSSFPAVSFSFPAWERHLITVVWTTVYVDWVNKWSVSNWTQCRPYDITINWRVPWDWNWWAAKYSHLIFEDRNRDAQEIVDYYNATKDLLS